MRIIKPGIIKKLFHICTCQECGCVVEFEPHEGEYFKDARDGTTSYKFACPTCRTILFAYGKGKPRGYPDIPPKVL